MKKKWLSLLLVGAMTAGMLAGCGSSSSSDSADSTAADGAEAATPTPDSSTDYDFYIFNGKGEIADGMQAAVDAYSNGA